MILTVRSPKSTKEYVSFEANLQLPAQGAWRLQAKVDLAPPKESDIEIDFRGQALKGYVASVEEQVDTFWVEVLPTTALRKVLPSKSYSAVGTVASYVREAVSAAGGVLHKSSVLPTGQRAWFRLEGTLAQTLQRLGVTWHCSSEGAIVIGVPGPEQTKGDYYFLGSRPAGGAEQVMLEPRTFIWPDATIRCVVYTETVQALGCTIFR